MKSLLILFAATLLPAQTDLGITVNGGAERIAWGSPLLVTATTTGPAETLEVRLSDADGRELALTPRAERTRSIRIGETVTVVRFWTLSPEDARQWRQGRYQARAIQGDRASAPAEFTLDLAEAPDLLLLARWEEWEGRAERALEMVNAVLAERPGHTAALVRKSEILAAQGESAAALRALDEAIRAVNGDGAADGAGDADGLMELRARRQGLLRVVLGEVSAADK